MNLPLRTRALFALVLLLFAGLIGRLTGADAAEATTGLIVGTITSENGQPIADARVSAASPSGRYSAVTDSRGRFAMLGVVPDSYIVSVEAAGYATGAHTELNVLNGQEEHASFRLAPSLRTIGSVRAQSKPFTVGGTSDAFTLTGDAARANLPTTSSSGLASYTQGTVQGAIANVPGVDLDPFANAILRGGRVSETVFDYDSIPIPQGLIAEPGGNVDGAQLPTTGIASTSVVLAGFSNESDNALGGVVNQIPAAGTYPGQSTFELANGLDGTKYHYSTIEVLGATPDLKWRYALAATSGSEDFRYGDGKTFYAGEAATYGIALQTRGQYSVETNVHYAATPKDDVSILALVGQAQYNQFGSPFSGQTVGRFDGNTTTYPGETNPNAPVSYAAGVRGFYDILKAQWAHTGSHIFSRLQIYQSQYGSSSGGPFWDEDGFPDGSISFFQKSSQRQNGVNFDNEALYGPHRLRFGAEYRTNTSFLEQVVPTADEFISSHPTIGSYLTYLGDTWQVSDRLAAMATARATHSHFKPDDGFAYDTGAIDPHFGLSYRLGSQYALRANFDHTTVAPAPLEADRVDSTNLDDNGNPAPFAPLAPETANDFTYSFEGGGRTQFRVTYYQKFEKNLIDVLPFNFKTAVSSGLNPNGLGIPTNIGDLRANGLELFVKNGGFTFQSNYVRAFSSSASQFAYNNLNAPAIEANHLFPVSYQPDFVASLGYEFRDKTRSWRVTPSVSYQTGYPYGNGKKVYQFEGDTDIPVQVNNDNYVNPGANYYFLKDPSQPFNTATNPYIGNLGTNEGSDPNTLRSTPQMLFNVHVEKDITKRLTAILDVANLFGYFAPTAYQTNAYLIGPPGYKGGNATYAHCYGQILAGTVPCAPGLPAGATPYTLGNGVPTQDGITQAVPWTYGTTGYIPQSYPLGRTIQLRLRYRL